MNHSLQLAIAAGALALAPSATPQGVANPGLRLGQQGLSGTPGLPVRTGSTQALGSTGDRTFIHFDDLGDQDSVGTYAGPIDVAFSIAFVGLVDQDAGGSGNFANEPSASSVITSISFGGGIDLSEPVNYAEFAYSINGGGVGLALTAFDAMGSQLDIANADTIGAASQGAPCTGDPTGDFCLWDRISVSTPTNAIASLSIASFPQTSLLDNMILFRNAVGERQCEALPNSVGVTGGLVATGSAAVVDNDFTLHAFHLPANENGYVVNSMNTGMTTVGDGLLCLGSGLGRHVLQIGNSGPDGIIETPIDLTMLPRSSGGPVAAMPGETWYFQLWHRDRDGTGSSFTDALAITFE